MEDELMDWSESMLLVMITLITRVLIKMTMNKERMTYNERHLKPTMSEQSDW